MTPRGWDEPGRWVMTRLIVEHCLFGGYYAEPPEGCDVCIAEDADRVLVGIPSIFD